MGLEQWRPVPYFANYEITERGSVRHKFTLNTLVVSSVGSVILVKDGIRHNRSVAKLVRQTFGERSYPVLNVDGFRPVPDYPGYSINRQGDVYDERSRRFLDHDRQDSVNLWQNGMRVHRSARKLAYAAFPEMRGH